MEFKIQKQEQQMLVYWEQNAGALQAKDYDTKVEDEDRVIQKPQMRHIEEEDEMKDLEVNIVLIMDYK